MPSPRLLPRRPLFCLGLLAVGGLCFAGQQGEADRPGKADGPAKGLTYYGTASCVRCHTEPLATDKPDYVLLTEYKTWSTQDKHSQAYKVLEGPRSQQMGRLLGIKVTESDQCLNCHATNVPKELRAESFNLADGVNCDACHGPSEKWYLPHQLPGWRKKPLKEKVALGMTNVRNPVTRSRLCLSCHVGSVSEGKVVTHEMYAAGHPPLPGIEVASFSDMMPRHWRYHSEKSEDIRKLVLESYHFPSPEFEKTQLTAVAGAAALQAALELLAAEAGKGAAEGKNGWPEFARFDCYACHHELKDQSWRQRQASPGKPGRPRMPAWPAVLVRASLRALGGNEAAFQKQLDRLHRAFDRQPFGRASEVAEAARELAAWTGQWADQVAAREFGPAEARALLSELIRLPEKQLPDYDTARQIAWAARIIHNELPASARAEKGDEALKQLNTLLKLDLPTGTSRSILEELAGNLKVIEAYDPFEFRRALAELTPEK